MSATLHSCSGGQHTGSMFDVDGSGYVHGRQLFAGSLQAENGQASECDK